MFYQSENSLHSDLIKLETGRDFSFPLHLHSSFELVLVTEGSMTITVDKKQYELTPGKAILVFPNQSHAFWTEAHSEHTICIFSPQLVRAYSGIFLHKLPEVHLFEPDPIHIKELLTLRGGESILKIKGLLYSLCADFDRSATYRERGDAKEDLLSRIFRFVEDHYGKECTLDALAAHTSYHSVYLSRYFKQYTGLTFTDHVNRYRVGEAAYMLKNSQQKILDIAYDCGFESLRSFNRNFKKIMQITPSKYRDSL